jgi:hypothetical protein
MEQQNIFQFQGAPLYRCQVYRYFNGLSRLYLSVFKPYQQVPFCYILFSDVGYFEGPMGWESADFFLAPAEDCIELMLRTGLIGEAVLRFPDAYASITETMRLYGVRTPVSDIRIVAGGAIRLDSLPEGL